MALFLHPEITPYYGHATDSYGKILSDLAEGVRRNEVVLGGSGPRHGSHACPYCHWPVRFEHADMAVPAENGADPPSSRE